MVGLIILKEAQAVGLTVMADGERLVIRGPKSGEEIARKLLDHKADVLDAITKDPLAGTLFEGPWEQNINNLGIAYWERPGIEHFEDIKPPDPCPKCNSLELWQNVLGDWKCMICNPPTTALRLLKLVNKIRRKNRLIQNK